MTNLDAKLASHMAQIAIGHVTKAYPHKLDHVLAGDWDSLTPRALHPIFFGSFDWHSCVHGWWTLLKLRRMFPHIDEAGAVAHLADNSFTAEKVGVELAYLSRPFSRGFERPYGWAWLLQLHLEATRHREAWGSELEPLARAFAERLSDYLNVLTYPIRAGTHFNTAFALILSLEWANDFDTALAERICERSLHWFGADRDCQAWEPGGDEFLSIQTISRHGSGISCRASTIGSLRPCSNLRSSATAATARSLIWTGSTSAAPGVGGASRHCSGRPSAPWRPALPMSIWQRRCRTSPATIWASIGSRALPCWRLCRNTRKPKPWSDQ